MAKFTDFFKFITPNQQTTEIQNQQGVDGQYASYGNYTWYQRLVQGSATRLTRYREYDLMDNDVEVARALDIIAEEMTTKNDKTDLPFDIEIQGEDGQGTLSDIEVMTLRTAARHWGTIHDWDNRLFKIARNTVKFGDCFFRRLDNYKKWEWIPPSNVLAAVVDVHDVTKIVGYQVRTDTKTPKAPGGITAVTQSQQHSTEYLAADQIIRFSLNDDMSDSAPFGESVLRPVYRTHKQKELLEDAILIYRIQRAPERRVFYIDVGKMPPQRVKQYLETIKNEIKQKKIPSAGGGYGGDQMESVYNPTSMTEDYYFAQRPDGRGSKVETLPGGEGLGEITDLDYFMDKVFRGLRVPVSWMKYGRGNDAPFQDGKVGTAYIEELRFALFVERLQGYVERVIDDEFKRYLRGANISIDPTLYKLRMPEPTNFGKYRQQELDGALLNMVSLADGVSYLAKRFVLTRFLQLTDDEVVTNEFLLRQEKGLDKSCADKDLPELYRHDEQGLAIGGGGMGGGGMGGLPPGDMGGLPPGEEGIPGEEGAGGEPGAEGGAPPPEGGAPPPG